MSASLPDIQALLTAAYGPAAAWPDSRDPFEKLVAVMLSVGTARKNAESALDRLRLADLLTPAALREVDVEELAELIRPAGRSQVKAGRLLRLLAHLWERHGGAVESLFAQSRDALHEELSSINGIGPETAAAIMLHAAGLPVFIADAGTHRIWKRHGWIDFEADSLMIQEQVEDGWQAPPAAFAELHRHLARVSAEHCRSQPQCDGCPLAPLLPANGPLTPDW